MNFLAHYILAKDRDSPAYHCGSLFPDMAKRAGFALQANHIIPYKGQFQDLTDGIDLHWKGDQLFHQSALFEFAAGAWKEIFKNEKLLVPHRRFFLFHLLAEMWLDKILLQEKPGEGKNLYKSLSMVSREEISAFSSLALNDANHRITQTLEDFLKRKFVLSYSDQNAFCQIASGVFFHVTKQTPTEELQRSIGKALVPLKEMEAKLLEHWSLFCADFQSP